MKINSQDSSDNTEVNTMEELCDDILRLKAEADATLTNLSKTLSMSVEDLKTKLDDPIVQRTLQRKLARQMLEFRDQVERERIFLDLINGSDHVVDGIKFKAEHFNDGWAAEAWSESVVKGSTEQAERYLHDPNMLPDQKLLQPLADAYMRANIERLTPKEIKSDLLLKLAMEKAGYLGNEDGKAIDASAILVFMTSQLACANMKDNKLLVLYLRKSLDLISESLTLGRNTRFGDAVVSKCSCEKNKTASAVAHEIIATDFVDLDPFAQEILRSRIIDYIDVYRESIVTPSELEMDAPFHAEQSIVLKAKQEFAMARMNLAREPADDSRKYFQREQAVRAAKNKLIGADEILLREQRINEAIRYSLENSKGVRDVISMFSTAFSDYKIALLTASAPYIKTLLTELSPAQNAYESEIFTSWQIRQRIQEIQQRIEMAERYDSLFSYNCNPYKAIGEICRRCQEIVVVNFSMSKLIDKKRRCSTNGPWRWSPGRFSGYMEVHEIVSAMLKATANIWQSYMAQVKRPVATRYCNFSGFLFINAELAHHGFENCDFRSCRFILTNGIGCKLSGSDFSNTIFIPSFPFILSDCTGCNFSEIQFGNDILFSDINFQDANFTNSSIVISSSSVKDTSNKKSKSNFTNALMTGCKIMIKQEANFKTSRGKVYSFLGQLFSPEQLASMKIEFDTKCFLATAACGAESNEVAILREYRDAILHKSKWGNVFINTYNMLSPPLAMLIGNYPFLRRLAKSLIVQPAAIYAASKLKT